jgi:hypothetical protein
MIVKNRKTDEDRAFWAHCEAVAAEVASWPGWMRGEADVAVKSVKSTEDTKTGENRSPGSGTKRES